MIPASFLTLSYTCPNCGDQSPLIIDEDSQMPEFPPECGECRTPVHQKVVEAAAIFCRAVREMRSKHQ